MWSCFVKFWSNSSDYMTRLWSCFVKFWSNSSDYMTRLAANTTEHTHPIELYIILATLEKLWMLESGTFNYKRTLSEAKPVQCSPANSRYAHFKKYHGLLARLPSQFNKFYVPPMANILISFSPHALTFSLAIRPPPPPSPPIHLLMELP